jgi:hypothetical protein
MPLALPGRTLASVTSNRDSRKLSPPPPGNADRYQNKGVAKKAIRKCMKAKVLKIDGVEGAIHKMMKRKGEENRMAPRHRGTEV